MLTALRSAPRLALPRAARVAPVKTSAAAAHLSTSALRPASSPSTHDQFANGSNSYYIEEMYKVYQKVRSTSVTFARRNPSSLPVALVYTCAATGVDGAWPHGLTLSFALLTCRIPPPFIRHGPSTLAVSTRGSGLKRPSALLPLWLHCRRASWRDKPHLMWLEVSRPVL